MRAIQDATATDQMAHMGSHDFVLDPRLAHDTALICDWPLSRVLLMNDRRYPWLVLAPRRASVSEAFDLEAADQALLWRETMEAARALKQSTACRKINIGALGNIVAQLHVHIIARKEGDAAWPGPVWGMGNAVCYDDAGLRAEVERYQTLLYGGGN